MSKNRIDYVRDEHYARHLYGDAKYYRINPAVNRTATIQRMYVRVLTELAANRFKWLGLPDSVDPRFLEMTLFYRALSVFFYDDDYNAYLALRGGGVGNVNMYDNPVRFFVEGNMYQNKTLMAVPWSDSHGNRFKAQCVPIWSNYMRTPDIDIVLIYASKLAELDVTIEINSKNMRSTKVLVSDENSRLSMQNINRQIDEGQPVLHVTNQAIIDNVVAFDLGIDPNSVEKLHILRTRLWNECMGLLGIDNANQDKKERLVADEVAANDEQVNMAKAVNLNSRQYACEGINKRYGLNLSVEYDKDAISQMATTFSSEVEE